MKIYSFLDPKHQTNVYLVVGEDGHTGILIDPASVGQKLINIIERTKIDLRHVLITHDHESHVESLGSLMKIYEPKVYSFLGRCQGYETEKVGDEDVLELGGSSFEAMHIPGHSLDSICYKVAGTIFTGDTLLSGSIAKTNTLIEKELLAMNIRRRIFTLDDNTLIMPGHGCPSKVRIEKMFNQDMLEAVASMT